MSLSSWAKSKSPKGKGTPYVSVVHNADGTRTVKDHASKKEAHAYGKELRAQGKTAYVHSKADAEKFGLAGSGGDQPRDDQGRFTH